MRPLPFTITPITISNVFQTYGSIFIPKNSVADFKLIITKFEFALITNAPNQVGGPNYSEQTQIPGNGTAARLAANHIGVVPSTYKGLAERQYYFDTVNIVELNVVPVPVPNSVAYSDYQGHNVIIPNLIAPFDRTIDNTIDLQIKTSFGASTDTLSLVWAQAWIQAPLDLRRLPR